MLAVFCYRDGTYIQKHLEKEITILLSFIKLLNKVLSTIIDFINYFLVQFKSKHTCTGSFVHLLFLVQTFIFLGAAIPLPIVSWKQPFLKVVFPLAS